ncbi:hypothetical protein VIRA109638_04990 [Vibrio rarus]
MSKLRSGRALILPYMEKTPYNAPKMPQDKIRLLIFTPKIIVRSLSRYDYA